MILERRNNEIKKAMKILMVRNIFNVQVLMMKEESNRHERRHHQILSSDV